MTSHRKDMRQDIPRTEAMSRQDGLDTQSEARNRANQQAASRPRVDAEHALDDRGNMTSTPHEGSTYQPLRMGSDEDRQRERNSEYVIDQGAGSAASGHHGTSRGGAITQHGDTIRETQSPPGGGSVFQPLEADPRHLEDREALQRGNPSGQNQQGLNDPRAQHDRDAARPETPRRGPDHR